MDHEDEPKLTPPRTWFCLVTILANFRRARVNLFIIDIDMEVGSDNNCEDNSISFDINEKVS